VQNRSAGASEGVSWPAWDAAVAADLIAPLVGVPGPTLPVLHAIQGHFGCIPSEAVAFVASALNLTRADVHGVVTFYGDFRQTPPGRRHVQLCRAEACQVVGGEAHASRLLSAVGVDWGGTSADGALTVSPVYCLGLCSVAPAALVDGEPHGRITADGLLQEIER
jgi:formate dehydrogenase subunit gamma